MLIYTQKIFAAKFFDTFGCMTFLETHFVAVKIFAGIHYTFKQSNNCIF